MKQDAVPISLDHAHFEYKIRVDAEQAEHYQIVNMLDIDGYNRTTKSYTHYASVTNALDTTAELAVYELFYRNRIGSNNPDLFISFYGQDQNTLDDEVISVSMLCCNGSLAEKIQPGDLNRGTDTSAHNITFKNLHKPSKYYPLNMDEGLRWRFITLLSYNFLGEASLQKLKEIILLELDVLKGIERKKVESRLEGIIELTTNYGNVLYR